MFYLKMYLDNYNPISLSSFNIPIDKSTPILESAENEIVRNTIFYKYVQKQRIIDKNISIVDCQVKFIKEYNAGFIILTPNTLVPTKINDMIDESIIDFQGNRFCKLRY